MAKARISLNIIMLLSSLTYLAKAENESIGDRLLGSPIAVLAAVIIIAAVAAVYHKVRR